MKHLKKWLIGVDEAGEKAWVRSAGSTLQDLLRNFNFQKVYSFSREAFARGCQVFLEVTKRNTDNLHSFCKKGVHTL